MKNIAQKAGDNQLRPAAHNFIIRGKGVTKTIERIINSAPLKLLNASVPRYTSYPTAPHFNKEINETKQRSWLKNLPKDEGVSVYIHIPFCDRLCWFCGCHTKQVNRYNPIRTYLKAVHSEIALLHNAIGFTPRLVNLHLGGGSPSIIHGDDLQQLRHVLEQHFHFDPEAQISVEIDPSDMTKQDFSGFKSFGITRASIGVQDFDKQVQQAINRPQTFEQTEKAVQTLRSIGITSLNIDALYGLPFQTQERIKTTIQQVLSLNPDRIALFGYAHVPWMKKHQKMIDEQHLPGPIERFAQSQLAASLLEDHGFISIGIDHFAKPQDALTKAKTNGCLHRNFQGYTEDACTTLLGLGASSISKLAQGYTQNETPTANYMRLVADGHLPVTRGIEMREDDYLYADIIEQLMCQFGFSLSWLHMRHGSNAQTIEELILEIRERDKEELTEFDGENFTINQKAHPFARIVASWFDARMREKNARYSVAV